MKFVDLSTGEGIGANCQYIELGPFKLVIDAGMNPKETGQAALPRFDLLPEHLDAIILTHCHLDHLGALPVLLRRYERTPLFMSVPSMMLARRMLHNSVNVMLRQRDELGRSDLPLYTHGEIERMGRQIVPMSFGRSRPVDKITEQLDVTLHQSGHVAGAAAVELQWRGKRIFHTGDVLFDAQRHMGGAQLPKKPVDLLITETTRGRASRLPQGKRADELERLFLRIGMTIERGGSVLIPVFALGRQQEMLCLLREARFEGYLPHCPIFSAGLGLDLANYFDDISRKTGIIKFRRQVLKDLHVRQLAQDLRPGRNPERGIYLLSSGMMVENTPSYAAAATMLHDPQNAVCIVGYCDADTPGGKLMATQPGEPFYFAALDYETPLRATVERFDLSGHADREELLEFAQDIQPGIALLSHGDAEARAWFKSQLEGSLRDGKVLDPRQHDTYAFDIG